MFSSSTNHNYNPISINENETCGNNDNGSGNDYVDRQMRHQQLEMRRQDEGLEMLSESASRLGTLSLGISEELGHQNRMLDEMEDGLERATTDLNVLSTKTKEFIKKSGGKRNFFIILGMSLVVVLLLFLIIYT